MAKSVYIADVCKEIFAGGDVPKSALSYEKTAEYNVPIFSNGEKNCGLYGYTNNARLKEPSITVSARGTIGYTAIRTEPFVPVVRLITLTPKSEVIDLDYLFYATQNYKFEGSGTSIPQLTVPMLKKYAFPLPELEEQKAIAKLFQKLDCLISLRKQQLAKLDELVKARFVEMFGDISNSRKVPMQDVCKIITDGTHQPPKFVLSGIPFLFVSNIVTNEIHYDAEKFISEETYNELIKRTPIEVGDVLLSTVGSYGHPAVVKENKPFCFQRHIAYLKPNNSVVNSEYLRCAILSTDLQRQIDESVKGIAQKTLNLSEIRKLRLPLPSLSLQNQFAAFVERIDQQKQTVQQSLEKLELMKKALMQKYFG